MKNLQDATERICELKGSLVAIDALLPALFEALPAGCLEALLRSFDAHCEAARTVLLHTDISDHVLAAFERDAGRLQGAVSVAGRRTGPRNGVEEVLLSTVRIATFRGSEALSGASGFFFRREERLYLVSNRHVFCDPASRHFPDRFEIGLHTDAQDLARGALFSIPLHRDGRAAWREAVDGAGTVDLAVIEIQVPQLPAPVLIHAFGPEHLDANGEDVTVGDAVIVVGFPLGLHDTVHQLPVARSATIASAYGVRFQRQDFFLTDARTHLGSSGSPVLRRRGDRSNDGSLQAWQLLGVFSTRLDMGGRDRVADESLGLNGVWYADVLQALTGGA